MKQTTQLERVKAALRKGTPPEQVAAAFGISVSLVLRVQRILLEKQASLVHRILSEK